MSENIPPANGLQTPSRKRGRDAHLASILQPVLVFHDDFVPAIPATPKNTNPTPQPLSKSTKATKQWQNGFEKAPKPLGYIPYATPKRQSQIHRNPFHTEHTMVLEPMQPLAVPEWNLLARRALLLPESAELHEFQMQAANLVLERTDDLMVIAPTGKGKSLLWSLPLLAQGNGISFVATPYQSLGMEGASSNHGEGVEAMYVYSENKRHQDIQALLHADKVVIYACVEMLESPTLAPMWTPEIYRRISAFYIDEAHGVHESSSWRPGYTNIYKLRDLIQRTARERGETIHIPIIALSATLPTSYQHSVAMHTGMRPDYQLINLGNHRPELSHVIINMQFDASSFKDLNFLLPLESRLPDLISTLGYSDDIELLTKMLWWFVTRLGSMGLPADLVDIVHAGMSQVHQVLAVADFRSGKTIFLLATDKVGAGMNFGKADRVFQYKIGGGKLTLPRWSQRRGRGGRKAGTKSTGYLLVEPGMTAEGGLAVESPGGEDPGIIALAHSAGGDSPQCADSVFDKWLENPARPPCNMATRQCCDTCHPELKPGHELQWIHTNPGSESVSSATVVRSTAAQRATILGELQKWRLSLWKGEWRDMWPSYGPQDLVSNVDLDLVAARAGTSVRTIDQLYHVTHVTHWPELSNSFFAAVQAALMLVHGAESIAEAEHANNPSASTVRRDDMPYESIVFVDGATVPKRRRVGEPVGQLKPYENIM